MWSRAYIYKDFDRLSLEGGERVVEESRSLRRNCILVVLLNFLENINLRFDTMIP